MLQKYESTFISVMNFYSSTDYQQYDKTGPVITNVNNMVDDDTSDCQW